MKLGAEKGKAVCLKAASNPADAVPRRTTIPYRLQSAFSRPELKSLSCWRTGAVDVCLLPAETHWIVAHP
jgi:hypothetical protein